jgi:HAD superfamily hydrolase (TIGR01509 family)
LRSLIFDCDGVLADTERHGHLPAFNRMFEELGLPVRWSEEEYASLLRIGGGKERLATVLTPDFVRQAGLPESRDAQLAEVARWHRRKTELFVAMVEEGRLPGRPGVARLAQEALEAAWSLAVCSTSSEASVRAILEHVVGPQTAARCLMLAGDIVEHKKPAPDVYLLALDRMRVEPRDTIVIEDSRNGLRAATAAGLRTVVTVNRYTEHEDFSEAVLVLTSLGDPGGERAGVLANRGRARPGPFVTLDDLEACLDPAAGEAP